MKLPPMNGLILRMKPWEYQGKQGISLQFSVGSDEHGMIISDATFTGDQMIALQTALHGLTLPVAGKLEMAMGTLKTEKGKDLTTLYPVSIKEAKPFNVA